ncbi:aminotransferase class V-fold PLP-dependent enzyme [Streptomyces sp. R39]|uniref:Aminotransferase class V-fold PLP-dependent enzyme n=1 Tax=Streptomyces sp. R39 TaxID=3238631 RepID=A0AB39QGQ5_9ACTN
MNGVSGSVPAHPALAGGPVYLDYNATTPVDPRVAEAMLPHLTDFFGNPSSSHRYADPPRRALAEARAEVAHLIGRVHLNGPGGRRLPNTLNISVDGVLGHELLAAVGEIAASTGSACHSGTHTPSPVLTAMGLDTARALGALRLSLGRWTTAGDIETAAAALVRAAAAQ